MHLRTQGGSGLMRIGSSKLFFPICEAEPLRALHFAGEGRSGQTRHVRQAQRRNGGRKTRSGEDIIAVKGVRMTAGSKVLADYIAPEDAAVVELLRKNGAVIVGKPKFQIPNPKQIPNSKLQKTKSGRPLAILGFGICLESGTWNLGFSLLGF